MNNNNLETNIALKSYIESKLEERKDKPYTMDRQFWLMLGLLFTMIATLATLAYGVIRIFI
jgi:hypothetical protein